MLLKNARVINPSDKTDAILDIRIEGEFIKEIASNISPLNDEMIYDFKDKVIVPGLVDIHCHLREPGFEGKETIKTGIDSALAGGYTAICPMANTKPAVDNLMALKYTLDKARESQPIGFYPICALTESLAGDRIVNISQLKEIGAAAFSDDGKPVENMKLLKIALEYANSLDTLIISHSEDSNLSKDGL
jgi:dihydroorotase